jgi:hypothetical protein
MKKPRLNGCDVQDLKDSLRRLYPFMLAIYRRLSGINVSDNFFSLNQSVFKSFLMHDLHLTGPGLRPEDCDRLFILVNGGGMLTHKEATNSDSQLIRFEFMELMMKVTIRKICENGPEESEAKALQVLGRDYLDMHRDMILKLAPYTYDSHKWRVDRYWNEPCDNLIKAYSSVFHSIFNTYSQK